MRLFLIRHGETVDNVAGLYAGSRDSPLTSHGVLQVRRLGQHLASRRPSIGPLTHVFSSDLQRAAYTAQAVIDAQSPPTIGLVTLQELRERDFGSSEGTSFTSKPQSGPARSVYQDAETHEQMRTRIARFLEVHLIPILESQESPDADDTSVVVVAHGIILNVLLSALLSKYAPMDLQSLIDGTGRPDYLTSWSNTGYAEIFVQPRVAEKTSTVSPGLSIPGPQAKFDIVALNETKHLEGLKKTRGGIGSAQFDKKQRTMDSFFGPSTKK